LALLGQMARRSRVSRRPPHKGGRNAEGEFRKLIARGLAEISPTDYRNELHGGCLLVVLEVSHRLAGLPSYRLLREGANEGGSHDITTPFSTPSWQVEQTLPTTA
jgi:hypothetical protein